jgi:hypothetical protein
LPFDTAPRAESSVQVWRRAVFTGPPAYQCRGGHHGRRMHVLSSPVGQRPCAAPTKKPVCACDPDILPHPDWILCKTIAGDYEGSQSVQAKSSIMGGPCFAGCHLRSALPGGPRTAANWLTQQQGGIVRELDNTLILQWRMSTMGQLAVSCLPSSPAPRSSPLGWEWNGNVQGTTHSPT